MLCYGHMVVDGEKREMKMPLIRLLKQWINPTEASIQQQEVVTTEWIRPRRHRQFMTGFIADDMKKCLISGTSNLSKPLQTNTEVSGKEVSVFQNFNFDDPRLKKSLNKDVDC